MNYFEWARTGVRKFTIMDIGCFKICLIAFTLMIAKLLPVVLTLEWYWYGMLFAVSYFWLIRRMVQYNKS